MVAGDVGVGDDLGVVAGEPLAEPADSDLQLLHRRRRIGQPPRRQPPVRNHLHPWRQHQRRLPGRHQLARLGGDLPAVKQHHLQLMQVSDPLLGGIVAVVLRRGIEAVQVVALAEQPDGLQRPGDVVVGDLTDMLDTGVQRDPADRPPHCLPG